MSTFADYIGRTEPGKSDKHVESRLNDMFGRGFDPLKVHYWRNSEMGSFLYFYMNFLIKYISIY